MGIRIEKWPYRQELPGGRKTKISIHIFVLKMIQTV